MRVRSGRVIQSCQNKNPRTRGYEWRHSPEACAGDFGGFEKSQLSGVLPRGKKVDFRLLAEARPVALWRVPHVFLVGGADGKANIERLYLSPYVEKPFNSKVIKSFVPELRSRKCFSCFGIPMFYVYMLWTFYVRFPYSCMGMLHKYKLLLHILNDFYIRVILGLIQ